MYLMQLDFDQNLNLFENSLGDGSLVEVYFVNDKDGCDSVLHFSTGQRPWQVLDMCLKGEFTHKN